MLELYEDCDDAVKSEAVSLSLSLSPPLVTLQCLAMVVYRLVVLALCWTSQSHLVVAPITKPPSQWLCNYCSMGRCWVWGLILP